MSHPLDPLPIARRIGHHFLAQAATTNTYNHQLAYEALLLLADDIDGVREAVRQVIQSNNIRPDTVLPWRNQQFHDLPYAWFADQGQLDDWQSSHLATTDTWMAEGPRRPNGALVHHVGGNPNIGPDDPVGSLLDMQQAYCLRLVRAARFTGDQRYVDECMLQYRTYREELRSASGCYHQGKGWLPGDGLSPAPWSRGQGWYLHGMVHCLPLLANWPGEQAELAAYTRELLDALIPFQQSSGLWHQLIDEPHRSRPDSSGSALILEAYSLFNQRYPSQRYEDIIARAWEALALLVDEEGVVDQACRGSGTIWKIDDYIDRTAPKGDPHGVFTLLFACAARHEVGK